MDEFELTSGDGSLFSSPALRRIMLFFRQIALGFEYYWIFVVFFICLLTVLVFAVIHFISLMSTSKRFSNFCIKDFKVDIFLKTIVYDTLYVPLLSNLMNVFICTYHCTYDPATMDVDPYPPLDLYPGLSCNSAGHIVFFIFACIAIFYFHLRASEFFVKDFYEEEDINTRDIRQRYLELSIRV